ncbi:MAG: hypothetical protein RL094_756 [Candidatus Parcubacteria bacterium]|jgi:preprotein translocase subunit YajC
MKFINYKTIIAMVLTVLVIWLIAQGPQTQRQEKATPVQGELSEQQIFVQTPAIVTTIKKVGDASWSIDLDVLTNNPKWTPGGNEMRFVNQSPRIRTLILDNNTKNFTCEDGVFKGSAQLIDGFTRQLAGYEREYKEGAHKSDLYYTFDITDTHIVATYEQCSS